MSKLRSVSTAFWSDPFIEDLTPNQKLLFLYLITNEKTNMLGIYEASIKKISFETGIKKEDVQKALKEFERLGKVKYVNNFVILINYMKHQNFNTNMKKSAIDIYNNLPKELKDSDLSISKDNPLKGFERLLNHYGMVSKVEVEYEVEYEVEVEEEIEDKDCDIDWTKLKNTFNEITGKQCRVVNTKTKNQLKARLKEGYTKEDIVHAIKTCFKEDYHVETNHKHLTLEFITRADKLDKYVNITEKKVTPTLKLK